MTTSSLKEQSYNEQLPLNLAVTIKQLKKEYNEADEAGKQALLDELTGWLMREKSLRVFKQNNT